MEVLEKNIKFGNSHPIFPHGEAYSKQDFVEKLIRFVTLTEEDRLRAGIYVGNEGREWIDRSALILSPPTGL